MACKRLSPNHKGSACTASFLARDRAGVSSPFSHAPSQLCGAARGARHSENRRRWQSEAAERRTTVFSAADPSAARSAGEDRTSGSGSISVQDLLKQAYDQGYQAGYQAGVKVDVQVDLSRTPFAPPAKQPPQTPPLQQAQAVAAQGAENGSAGDSAADASRNGREANSAADGAAAAGEKRKAGDVEAPHDSLLRSAAKALLWRIFSTSATVLIATFVLRGHLQVDEALEIGGLEFVVKFMLYFLHERLWAVLPVF